MPSRSTFAPLALLALLLALPAGASTVPDAPALRLDAAAVASLQRPGLGLVSVAAAAGAKAGEPGRWTFRPLPLRAPGSLDVEGKTRAPAGTAFAWVGSDGSTRLGLRLDANGGVAFAVALAGGRMQRLEARPVADGIELLPLAGATAPEPVFDCGTDAFAARGAAPGMAMPPLVPLMSPGDVRRWQAKGVSTPGHEAVVGIHVDHYMMDDRFGDSSAAASAWLDDLFIATNVFYMRDVALRLVRGHTVYETGGNDPFSASSNVFGQESLEFLSEFGAYWRNNFSAQDRAFVVMISGRRTSGAPTGFAWIGEFCEDGYNATVNGIPVTAGSYGVNLFRVGSNIAAEVAADLFGHELGHNLGAIHNHCTDADGNAGNGFQPIDQCANSVDFGATVCHGGATSCPTGGSGLLMSVCGNIGCGSRILEFHPAQIAIVGANIAANSPSCLAPVTFEEIDPDRFFYSSFEAGETAPD